MKNLVNLAALASLVLALSSVSSGQGSFREVPTDDRRAAREIRKDDFSPLLMFNLGKELTFAALLTAVDGDAGPSLRKAELICKLLGAPLPDLVDQKGTSLKEGTKVERDARALNFVLRVAPEKLVGPIRKKYGPRGVSAYELGLKVTLLAKFGEMDLVRDAVKTVIARCGPRTRLPGRLWRPLLEALEKSTPDAKEEKRLLLAMMNDMDAALKKATDLELGRKVKPAAPPPRPWRNERSDRRMRRRAELWSLGFVVMPYAVAAAEDRSGAGVTRRRLDRLAAEAGAKLPPLSDSEGTPLRELDSRARFLGAAVWAMRCGQLLHAGLEKKVGAEEAAAFRLGLDASLSSLICGAKGGPRTEMRRRMLKDGRRSGLPEPTWLPLAERLKTPCELAELSPVRDATRKAVKDLQRRLAGNSQAARR